MFQASNHMHLSVTLLLPDMRMKKEEEEAVEQNWLRLRQVTQSFYHKHKALDSTVNAKNQVST